MWLSVVDVWRRVVPVFGSLWDSFSVSQLLSLQFGSWWPVSIMVGYTPFSVYVVAVVFSHSLFACLFSSWKLKGCQWLACRQPASAECFHLSRITYLQIWTFRRIMELIKNDCNKISSHMQSLTSDQLCSIQLIMLCVRAERTFWELFLCMNCN